jgi:NADPH:quinone reductase-like Zn-dependent oxidoreductase
MFVSMKADATGVRCTANMDLVKSLGAEKVIDYTRENFTENGEVYDIVFDVANKSSFIKCKNSLSAKGIYLNPVLSASTLLQMIWTRAFTKQKAMFSATGFLPISKRRAFLEELTKLCETGKLKTIIDKRYRLEQMAEAHRYVESENRKGNVIINMD